MEAPGKAATASAMVRAWVRTTSPPQSCNPWPARLPAASSKAAVAAAASVAATATTRSLGPASAAASVRRPALARTSRFAGVAMTSPARSMPSTASRDAAICISSTESR